MASSRKQAALATFCIFLLLSADPLAAHRLSQAKGKLSEGARLGVGAPAEDVPASSAAKLSIGQQMSRRLTCTRLERDHLRRSGKLAAMASSETMRSDSKLRMKDAAKATLKLHRLTKGLQKASKMNCEWVSGASDHLTDPLLQFTSASTQHNPCMAEAREVIESSQSSGAEQQAAAFSKAIAMMMSPSCKPPLEAELSSNTTCGEECVKDLTEEDDQLSLQVSGSTFYSASSTAGALVQLSSLSNAFVVSELKSDALLVETISAFLLGVVAILLSIAVCWITVAITVLIIGVILCVLKALFLMLLGLITGKNDAIDVGGCARFWLNAVGFDGFKSIQGPAVLLASCAIPHILPHLGLAHISTAPVAIGR